MGRVAELGSLCNLLIRFASYGLHFLHLTREAQPGLLHHPLPLLHIAPDNFLKHGRRAAHGLDARKRFGQHFLFDLNLTRRIARAAAPIFSGFRVFTNSTRKRSKSLSLDKGL